MRYALTRVEAVRVAFMALLFVGHVGRPYVYPAADLCVTGFFCVSFATLAFVHEGAAGWAFLAKRAARLLPLYYAALAAHAALAWPCAHANWWFRGSAVAEALPRGVVAALNAAASACWLGVALPTTAGTLWMLQTMLWMFAWFGPVLAAAEVRAAAGRAVPPTAWLREAALCLAWPPVVAALYYVAARAWLPGSTALAAVFAARECPLTRLPLMRMCVGVTARLRAGWRPSARERAVAWGGALVLAALDVLPLSGGWKLWRTAEYLSQPFLAAGVPFLLAWDVDEPCEDPRVQAAAGLSRYNLSFYAWQSTAIWLALAQARGSIVCEPGPAEVARLSLVVLAQLAAMTALSERFVERPSNAWLKRRIEAASERGWVLLSPR